MNYTELYFKKSDISLADREYNIRYTGVSHTESLQDGAGDI